MTEKRFKKFRKVPAITYEKVEKESEQLKKIQDLVRIIKKIDGTKTNRMIAESYNKELQQLSDGRIGLRIWNDFDNTLRCIIVYPNSAIKERIEWGLNL